MQWRVIPLEETDSAMNMAIDEAIMEGVRLGTSPPTIRFYGWRPKAISIGYFQSLALEVDTAACARFGIDIVRRRTGGGAVFHDHEITYSIIGKEALFAAGITESYKRICGLVIDALQRLGMNAEFHPINDVLVGDKKISGNAQTRRKGVLLQHGTLLYEVNVDQMFQLLKVKDIKIKDKLITDVKQRVTSIRLQRPNLTKYDVYNALVSSFTKDKEYTISGLLPQERILAERLKEERYKNKKWTEQR